LNIWRTSDLIEQIVRIVCMKIFLEPAAYALPKKLALFIADALALLLVALPKPGLETYYQMKNAYGKSRLGSLNLT